MGWERVTMTATGQVSRHNGDQDRLDDAAWEEFCERVRAIAAEHRYDSLEIDV